MIRRSRAFIGPRGKASPVSRTRSAATRAISLSSSIRRRRQSSQSKLILPKSPSSKTHSFQDQVFDSVQKLSIPFQKKVGILPRELDHKLWVLGRRFNGSRTLLATDRDQKIKPAVFDHLLCERFDGRQAGFHRSRRFVRRCCTHRFPFYQALLFTATCFLGADLADPEA